MPDFLSHDGTRLAYHLGGAGDPVICLPGGPGRASGYLEELGGLSRHRLLVRLDNRGTGGSDRPEDPASYRADRLVEDVEALRVRLGLDQIDLLGHSAAANVAVLYAARHPERIRTLILVAPGLTATGVELTDAEWYAAVHALADRDYYPDAYAALVAWDKGEDTPELRERALPLYMYGLWNDAARAHAVAHTGDRAEEAADGFGGFDAVDVSAVTAPVLVLAGALDPAPSPAKAAELAALFPDARVVVDPLSGHCPWITNPAFFTETLREFLS